jgi:hypothetical protein
LTNLDVNRPFLGDRGGECPVDDSGYLIDAVDANGQLVIRSNTLRSVASPGLMVHNRTR